MDEILKILGHAAMPRLDRCELVAEYVRHGEAKAPVFDQNVSKPKGGRPEGGITRAAKELPVPGKTFLGRRQYIKRAITIDELFPETKAAARDAKLDDIQTALLDIVTSIRWKTAGQSAGDRSSPAAPRRKRGNAKQAMTNDVGQLDSSPRYF